ncbi:MAG: putative baseplate assembly protein [Chloroflexi bacterium]|nr:putative baseplate assembly protein [Chloroflexota bacterium]
MVTYSCCGDDRRRVLGEHGGLKGIDYVEVSPDQATIFVHFLPAEQGIAKDPVPHSLTADNVRITGGERVTTIRVTGVSYAGNVLVVTVADDSAATSGVGDFSTYTLHLAGVPDLDPRLSSIAFSFKAGCPTDFDPKAAPGCPVEPSVRPEISYLAKDYASFRQLMLDRLSLLMPGWTERNPADTGIMLVELLAHVGDLLSYRQDAVATEAYLSTARLRTSVRRHVRLVDYDMHDGCNARTWAQVRVSAERLRLPAGTQLLTAVENQPIRIAPGTAAYVEAISQGPEVFETVEPAALYAEHNRLTFYTWGDRDCCLPKAATSATLAGKLPRLTAGDVLLLVQQRDPVTGLQEDADRDRRHAVRLTHVRTIEDPLGGRLDPSPDDNPRPVTHIEWAAEDALPFPFCISGTGSATGKYHEDITVALGNVVLADHGRSLPYPELYHEGRVLAGPALPRPEALPAAPAPTLFLAADRGAGRARCERAAQEPVPVRYRPQLKSGPLTQAVPYRQEPLFGLSFTAAQGTELDSGTLPADLRRELVDRGLQPDPDGTAIQGGADEWSLSDDHRGFVLRREPEPSGSGERLNVYALPPPARRITQWSARDARPAVILYSPNAEDTARSQWTPVRHLLNSGPASREFVVEVENDGSAKIRFGDDRFGQRPNQGATFDAVYRVGNGSRGNIGAETLVHIVSTEPGISSVTNPLPAWGGVEPESADHARQMAPYVFRTQERAVTPDDYAEVAMRHPGVQRAAATLRWTGSWFTVQLTGDRFGGLEVDDPFERELGRFLDRYRMAGQDVEIEGPHTVPLEIEMRVCLKPDASRSDVAEQLLAIYSAGTLPDGRRGVFHPDDFTFGQPVYLSQVYRAAEGIAGVASYEITTFQRQGAPSRKGLDEGKLALGRLEIARLDNNPNFPEHGVFRLKLEGGR